MGFSVGISGYTIAYMNTTTTTTPFHELVDHHRKAHGLSYHQLAERAWTTPSFVFRICRGEAKPSYTVVLRLAIAIGLPLEHVDELVRAAGYIPLLDLNGTGIPTPTRRERAGGVRDTG